MNFLSVPEEVIEGSILPYLKWNDLLRFRRVCKVTREITQGYMRVHPELAPEIEIGEGDKKKSFGALLKMSIPTNRIFLNNPSGDEFFQKDGKNIAKFLEKCGPRVKHLRMKMFSLCPHGKEWDFMEGLINLQSFEAEYFGVGNKATTTTIEELERVLKEKIWVANQDLRFVQNFIPSVLWKLKSFRIGQQKDIRIRNIANRIGAILDKNPYIEHVSLPFNSYYGSINTFTLLEGDHSQDALAMVFRFLNACIQRRAGKPYNNLNLKTIDFCCYHDQVGVEAVQMEGIGSSMFLLLLGTCIKYGVQLKNVGPTWFSQWGSHPEISSADLGIPVLSLVNFNDGILPVNMPNLERIEIRAFSLSTPGPQWRRHRPDWPALKSLDFTVDCKQNVCSLLNNGQESDVYIQECKVIFQFFFQGIRRTNLTEIRLHFTKEAGEVAIPKTDDIVESCPNLKKITLINWPGTNKALTKLWAGLSALEDISLECCKELGNVAFVGEDAQNPVFFKLKKLRKLSLKGLDQMPKVTDTLFSLVLQHLNLTHFILTSNSQMKSITSVGILSLLEGTFAEKIEKFPFQHWSLTDVSPVEFKKMEAKFRSYNMI